MGFPNARKQAMFDQSLGSGAPATIYIAALLTMPAEDGTGYTEPSGGSYARKSVTNNSTNFPAASMSGSEVQKMLAVAQSFVQATASWGTIVGFGLFDSGTAGAGTCYGFAEAIFAPKVAVVVPATNLFTATTHGLAASMEVQFRVQNGTLPAPLASGTVYYVIASGLTANDFKVSATLGGAELDITTTGDGTIRVFQNFKKSVGNGDTVTIPANQFVFSGAPAY